MAPAEPTDGADLRVGYQSYRRNTERPFHLVYIPTHRPFESVLARVVDEIRRSMDEVPAEFQLLLIDDRPKPLDADNRAAAARVARTAGFAVNWLGQSEWAEFVSHLTLHDELNLEQLRLVRRALLKPTGSYAGGMNKASLLAAFFGASSLHRRDSDEFPGYSSEIAATTLQIEVVALNTNADDSITWEGERPYFLGSHVLGQPTKDHRDLSILSAGLEEDLERISSRRNRVTLPTRRDAQAQVLRLGSGILRLERDNSGRTEVGVSASRKVFEWIPEMPAVGVLGTDHFQKGLLYQLDLPVAWHPVPATHVYDEERLGQQDAAAIRWYILAEFRYSVLRQYWNVANNNLWLNRSRLLSHHEGFAADEYANAFLNALDSASSEAELAARSFVEIFERAHDLARNDVRERHRARLDTLKDAEPEVDVYVREAVREFAELARIWPQLIEIARSIGLRVRRGVYG